MQGGNSFGATATLGTNDANDLQLETGGTSKLTVQNSTGNVGIGTTAPRTKLDVNSGILTPYAGSSLVDKASGLFVQAGSDVGTAFGIGVAGGLYYQPSNDGANNNFDFRTSTANGSLGAVNVRIQNNGNVGIGTTAPGAKLDVRGSGAGQTTFEANGQDDTTGLIARFRRPAAGESDLTIGAIGNTTSVIASESDLQLATGQSGQSLGNAKVTIQNSTGNVGIGHTSPASRFVVADGNNSTRSFQVDSVGRGTFRMDDNAFQDVLKLQNAGMTAAGHGAGIQFSLGQTNAPFTAGKINMVAEDTWAAAANRDSSLQFATALDGNVSEKLRITSTGNVGIGTATPNNKLSVVGNIAASGSITANVASPDLAEMIPAADGVEEADVVAADPASAETVKKAGRADSLLGVIADNNSSFKINPYEGMADAPKNIKPLVLAGRVPVKVTGEGGPVKIGDYLSASATPGHAMKATRAGATVGKALAGFDKDRGTVLALINVSYHDPATSDLQQSTDADMSKLNQGMMAGQVKELQVAEKLITQTLAVAGDAEVKGNLKVGGTLELSDDSRASNVTVKKGSKQIKVTFPKPQVDDHYVATVEKSWFVEHRITNKTKDGFTVEFKKGAPKNATVDWLIVR